MKCKNCQSDGGPSGNKHVKGRKFTCYRRDNSGNPIMDVPVGTLTDWSATNESNYTGSSGADCSPSGD